MKTMQAAVFAEKGKIQLREVPRPVAGGVLQVAIRP
jgi:hypothetical protein